MDKKIQLITYISNFVPEIGFLTDQQDKFIPITHPSAEIAAQKLLNHEDGDYLSGYIKIMCDEKVIVSEKEWTEELLETWSDLSCIVSDGASEETYHIELLDNPDKLYLVKKENGYFFEINKLAMDDHQEAVQSPVIPTSKLLEAILSGYQEFMTFCTQKNLTFSGESLLHSSIEALKNLENKKN